MPVLEQFKNFIRHGKAAKDSPLGPSPDGVVYDAQGHAYVMESSINPSSSSSTGASGTAASSSTNGAGQSQYAPQPHSGAQHASASTDTSADAAQGRFASASTGSSSSGANNGARSAADANSASGSSSSRAQQHAAATVAASAAGMAGIGSGAPTVNVPGASSPGLTAGTAASAAAQQNQQQNQNDQQQQHKDVAAQMVEEERKASEKMPVYEGLSERFLLICKMGDGAFSNVYKARDKQTGQKVAIKVVRKYELNSNQRANILKEVQIMRGLKHDGIVRLLDFSESRDHYYLVLELLEGGELFHQIVKLTYFSEPLARHVIMQVASGIRYLHEEKGVVHRDIKPENLLFESIKIIPSKYNKARPYDEEKEDEGEFMPGIGGGGIGKVKIADFGLSKIVWEESTMTPCGTVGYTAPEIVKDERYSKSVDMWALGCVLYTLLCGFPPFYDESISVLTEKVARGHYTFLSPWWDDISHSAKDLITHLLCVDPRKRYTIDEFLAHPWCNVRDPAPALNSADILLAKASEMPLDSPLLRSMKGTKANQRGLMSPGINQLKEAFDITYAVHRMEEEGAQRKGYNAGNKGELMGLNEEEEEDEVEETSRKYGQEVGRAVERQRGARGSEASTASSSSARQQQQQQQQQAAQHYPGRGGADPKLAAAVLYDGRAGQRDRGSRSNKRAFELNMNNATLLGRRGKAMDPGLGSLDSRIAAGGSASPMRVD